MRRRLQEMTHAAAAAAAAAKPDGGRVCGAGLENKTMRCKRQRSHASKRQLRDSFIPRLDDGAWNTHQRQRAHSAPGTGPPMPMRNVRGLLRARESSKTLPSLKR
jgi:hypothetical protein